MPWVWPISSITLFRHQIVVTLASRDPILARAFGGFLPRPYGIKFRKTVQSKSRRIRGWKGLPMVWVAGRLGAIRLAFDGTTMETWSER
jgi:hypothetical protein